MNPHPSACPTTATSGAPSTVAAVRPANAKGTARPLRTGSTRSAATTAAMPQEHTVPGGRHDPAGHDGAGGRAEHRHEDASHEQSRRGEQRRPAAQVGTGDDHRRANRHTQHVDGVQTVHGAERHTPRSRAPVAAASIAVTSCRPSCWLAKYQNQYPRHGCPPASAAPTGHPVYTVRIYQRCRANLSAPAAVIRGHRTQGPVQVVEAA